MAAARRCQRSHIQRSAWQDTETRSSAGRSSGISVSHIQRSAWQDTETPGRGRGRDDGPCATFNDPLGRILKRPGDAIAELDIPGHIQRSAWQDTETTRMNDGYSTAYAATFNDP